MAASAWKELLARTGDNVALRCGSVAQVEACSHGGKDGYRFTLVTPHDWVRLFEEPPRDATDWTVLPRWYSFSYHLPGSGPSLVAAGATRDPSEHCQHQRTHTYVRDDDIEDIVADAVAVARACVKSDEVNRLEKMKAESFIAFYESCVADADEKSALPVSVREGMGNK